MVAIAVHVVTVHVFSFPLSSFPAPCVSLIAGHRDIFCFLFHAACSSRHFRSATISANLVSSENVSASAAILIHLRWGGISSCSYSFSFSFISRRLLLAARRFRRTSSRFATCARRARADGREAGPARARCKPEARLQDAAEAGPAPRAVPSVASIETGRATSRTAPTARTAAYPHERVPPLWWWWPRCGGFVCGR